jgi:hypothetical protein
MGALVILGLLCAAPNTNPWELVNEDDGIKVWRRDVPGKDLAEAKAQWVIRQPAERVWKVIEDIEKYVEFMPYVQEIRIMGKKGGESFVYHRIDPPLVDAREYTLRMQDEIIDGLWIRRWSLADDKGPAKREDSVHLSVSDGSWTIERLEDGRTHLTYWLYTDPGGSIPNWIANKANTISLPDVMRAIAKRAEDPTWKND